MGEYRRFKLRLAKIARQCIAVFQNVSSSHLVLFSRTHLASKVPIHIGPSVSLSLNLDLPIRESECT